VVAHAQLPALDYGALAAASFMPATPLLPHHGLRFLPPSPSHSGNTTLNAASLDSRTASGTLTSSLTAVNPNPSNGGFTPSPHGGNPNAAATPHAYGVSHHHTPGGGVPGLGHHIGQAGGGGGLHARLNAAAAAGQGAGGGGNVGLGGLSGMGLSNGYTFDRWGARRLQPWAGLLWEVSIHEAGERACQDTSVHARPSQLEKYQKLVLPAASAGRGCRTRGPWAASAAWA
jgi:hypothetical protein